MVREIEKRRRAEHRTRSELIREALRTYFARGPFPEVQPTRAELHALQTGREALKRGEYVTYDQLIHALESSRSRPRRKKASAAQR